MYLYTILLYSRTLHRCEAASVGYAHAPGGRRRWRWRHGSCMVGDAGGIEPACTDAPDGAPPNGERKDALDTVAHRRMSSTSSFCRRCRRRRLLGRQATTDKPHQAEAPQLAPVAPRGALPSSPLHQSTSCTARARTQRHRLVAARARAGPTWESECSSTVARASRAAHSHAGRSSMASGSLGAAPSAPTRLEPAAAGRRRASARG